MNFTKNVLLLASCVAFLTATVVFFAYHTRNRSLTTARDIYSVLDHYRITYDIDNHSMDSTSSTTPVAAKNVEQAVKNLDYFVAQNLPIKMLLVGFPFKSGNQEKKVNGYLPDMAERTSLEYLQGMLNEIKAIYKPGAHIHIFCDGIPFAQFFGIPIKHVVAYENSLKALAQDLPDMSIFSSQDFMQKYGLASAHDIVQFIDRFEPSDEEYRKELKAIPNTALQRFALELDHPQGQKLIKKYTLKDIVFRLLARETRLRNYIAKTFPSPEYFRLTVHFSPDVSKKFGIRLSPTSDVTPYHGVMVQEDGTWSIRFKKDVDEEQFVYDTMTVNGVVCGYYRKK